MLKLTIFVVENKISDIVPNQFALAFDGWSEGACHYLVLFALSQANLMLDMTSVFIVFPTTRQIKTNHSITLGVHF
jgi:hypothetical protein